MTRVVSVPDLTDISLLTTEQQRAVSNYVMGGLEAIAEANREVAARGLLLRAVEFAVTMYPAPEDTK